MNLSEDLAWRGLIKDKTFGDINWLDQPRKFYLGLDASAKSFTIGNLAVLILARRFMDAGWQAVILAGGATSLIGDPGGKDKERSLKSEDEITDNIQSIKQQIKQILSHEEFELVDNYDWFKEVKYLDFLRDVGKNYSMTELMQRDFVTERMNEGGGGISYAEFSYSLIQGYDFWWLYKNKQVELQIGASDQWGNMISGVPLVRKKENAQVHAMSMPLVINKTTGRKFGKSEEGAIWLDSNLTSPSDFYQFWVNVDDFETREFFKIYTFLDHDEISEILAKHHEDPAKRYAQNKLASEITLLVHGEDGLSQAQKRMHVINSASSDSSELGEPDLIVKAGTSLVEVLVRSGLVSSNSEARRLIESGAIYMNNDATQKEQIEESDFKNNKLLLRKGKKLSNSTVIGLEEL
jgi:tyrosyl-tRNA synthetase